MYRAGTVHSAPPVSIVGIVDEDVETAGFVIDSFDCGTDFCLLSHIESDCPLVILPAVRSYRYSPPRDGDFLQFVTAGSIRRCNVIGVPGAGIDGCTSLNEVRSNLFADAASGTGD